MLAIMSQVPKCGVSLRRAGNRGGSKSKHWTEERKERTNHQLFCATAVFSKRYRYCVLLPARCLQLFHGVGAKVAKKRRKKRRGDEARRGCIQYVIVILILSPGVCQSALFYDF